MDKDSSNFRDKSSKPPFIREASPCQGPIVAVPTIHDGRFPTIWCLNFDFSSSTTPKRHSRTVCGPTDLWWTNDGFQLRASHKELPYEGETKKNFITCSEFVIARHASMQPPAGWPPQAVV